MAVVVVLVAVGIVDVVGVVVLAVVVVVLVDGTSTWHVYTWHVHLAYEKTAFKSLLHGRKMNRERAKCCHRVSVEFPPTVHDYLWVPLHTLCSPPQNLVSEAPLDTRSLGRA